jgi:hypothetical protein
MNNITFTFITFTLGMLAFPAMVVVCRKAQTRLNTGVPIKLHGETLGHVIVVRHSGCKRYSAVVNYELGRLFYTRNEAEADVVDRSMAKSEERRPSFSRP